MTYLLINIEYNSLISSNRIRLANIGLKIGEFYMLLFQYMEFLFTNFSVKGLGREGGIVLIKLSL